MKKSKRLISLLCVGLFLVSCKQSETANVKWSPWYDNGDGTHSRYDTNQISHTETEDHKLVFDHYIVEPTDKTPGEGEFICSECSAHIHQHVKPTGNYTYDQEVVDDQFLYEKRSEHTAIYFKSSVEGAYGDTNCLFEVSDLPKEYSEIDGITSKGVDVIETPFESNEKYKIIKNGQEGEDILPAEYKQVEYIDLHGHQGFNTGLKINTSLRVVMDIEFKSISQFYNCLLVPGDENDLSFAVGIKGENQNLGYQCFEDSFTSAFSFGPTRYLIDVSLNGRIAVNNRILRNSQEFSPQSSNSDLHMFGVNDEDEYPVKAKIYSVKIYNGEELVRDYIPAYKMQYKVSGFVDLVNSTFMQSCSPAAARYGDEIYSSDKDNFKEEYLKGDVAPVYDFNGVYPDYYQLDYLLSNSSQYIITDTVVNHKKFIIDVQFLPNGNEQYMGVDGSKNAHFGIYNNHFSLIGNSNNNPMDSRVTIHYDVNNMSENKVNTWFSNSNTISTGSTDTAERWNEVMKRKFQIFNMTSYTDNYGRYYMNCRFYGMKVFDEGGQLINDFTPALSKISGQAGLLDLNTGKFYISEALPLSYGNIMDEIYDTNKINIFAKPWSKYVHPIGERISEFKIVDKDENEVAATYVPARRNSDSQVGFYDTIGNTFIPVEGDSFTAGEIIGHMFGKPTVIKEPTQDEEGDSVRTCAICGEQIHEHTGTTAFKVTFDLSAVDLDKVKIFNSNDPDDYFEGTSAYTRNKYTYNYSRYNAYIEFEVPGNYNVAASSGTRSRNGNIWRIDDIRMNVVIKITPNFSV